MAKRIFNVKEAHRLGFKPSGLLSPPQTEETPPSAPPVPVERNEETQKALRVLAEQMQQGAVRQQEILAAVLALAKRPINLITERTDAPAGWNTLEVAAISRDRTGRVDRWKITKEPVSQV